jgi:hypothetical protein
MVLKLILAIFFLGFGAWLLIWPWLNPAAPNLTIGNTGISAAWLAILMGLFNLARWLNSRAARTLREGELDQLAQRRRRRDFERRARGYEEPDPNFDFRDPEPGTEIQRDPGKPPQA